MEKLRTSTEVAKEIQNISCNYYAENEVDIARYNEQVAQEIVKYRKELLAELTGKIAEASAPRCSLCDSDETIVCVEKVDQVVAEMNNQK